MMIEVSCPPISPFPLHSFELLILASETSHVVESLLPLESEDIDVRVTQIIPHFESWIVRIYQISGGNVRNRDLHQSEQKRPRGGVGHTFRIEDDQTGHHADGMPVKQPRS